jgi:type IV pilus assembly protein PilC
MPDMTSAFFSPRIRKKELAQLCRRLGTSLAAGLDLRKIWEREAKSSGRAAVLRRARVIRDAVAGGESMADGIDQCGDFFPSLFRQLARVGDETGSGAEVFRQLADHYDEELKRRRIFLAACTWPAIQLMATICIIGALIWVLGMIGDGKTDVVGFGLTGTSGLMTYLAVVCGLGMIVLLVVRAFQRGVMWIRPVQRLVLTLPTIGAALQTLALSRLAWVMHLTMNTGMDVRRAMRLSLEGTNQARYIDDIPLIDRWIEQGGSIYEAFVEAGGYPAEFLDALQVGEESGRLVAAMENLSKQYQDRARTALAVLMTVAGFLVWAIVAVIIIYFIFRLFFFYLGVLTSLTG